MPAISIGKFQFPSKEAAKRFGSALLERNGINGLLEGEDAAFADAVLQRRLDKKREIGKRAVVGFVVKMHRGEDHHTPCICAQLDDGSFLDISFWKVIRSYPNLIE